MEDFTESKQNNIKDLSYGHLITIFGKKYLVSGSITFEQGKYQWVEYELTHALNKKKWLSIDVRSQKKFYSLYEIISSRTYFSLNSSARLLEKGSAKVIKRDGSVDVSINDSVRFKEYKTTDGKFLSEESWKCNGVWEDSSDTEYSRGQTIDEKDIYISPNKKNYLFRKFFVNIRKFIFILASIFLLIVGALVIDATNPDKTFLSKYVTNNSNYEYITSITDTKNNKLKANIYKSNKPIVEIVKEIISNNPDIVKTIDVNSLGLKDGELSEYNINYDVTTNEGYEHLLHYPRDTILQTSNEVMLIYTNEKNETFIQVSKKDYGKNKDNMLYKPSNLSTHAFYYNIIMNQSTYEFNNSRRRVHRPYNSFRQQSIQTRKSMGGGTSHGK